MQDDKDDLTDREKQIKGYPSFVEERDPTPIGSNVVSMWKMVVYYRIDGCMKTNDTYLPTIGVDNCMKVRLKRRLSTICMDSCMKVRFKKTLSTICTDSCMKANDMYLPTIGIDSCMKVRL